MKVREQQYESWVGNKINEFNTQNGVLNYDPNLKVTFKK